MSIVTLLHLTEQVLVCVCDVMPKDELIFAVFEVRTLCTQDMFIIATFFMQCKIKSSLVLTEGASLDGSWDHILPRSRW